VARFAPVPIMPSCATVAPVRGDPRNGPSVVIVKLAAGCRVPWHWHTPHEDVIVASGTGVLEMKDGKRLQFRPGAYASMPSHHVHQARCSRTCAFFSISDDTFDIHYVDDAGNEIPMDEALKKQAGRKAKKKHPVRRRRSSALLSESHFRRVAIVRRRADSPVCAGPESSV